MLSGGLPARGVLGAAEIRRLLRADPPLLSGLTAPEVQIQPNGVDLCLDSVWQSLGGGELGREHRLVPERREVTAGPDRWYRLAPGSYVVRLVETVALPTQLMALGFSRSTLLRSGCAVLSAVWDAGYVGRSEVLLSVQNPAGFAIERGARIMQLVFITLTEPTEAYDGAYQAEHVSSGPRAAPV